MKRITFALLALACLPVLATDYPAGAYQPYYGDVDGDGINDIYLHATDIVFPIGLESQISFPMVLPPSLPSMLVRGTSSDFAQPQSHARLTDTQIAASGLQSDKYEFHSGDFDGDGTRDALLHGLDSGLLSLTLRGTATSSPPAVPIMQVLHPNISNGVPDLSNFETLSIQDFDSDGDDDVLIHGLPKHAMFSNSGTLGSYQQWDDASDITYMTFNVHWPTKALEDNSTTALRWEKREKQIKNVIREYDPDIIAFQELYDRHGLNSHSAYGLSPTIPVGFLNEGAFDEYGKCWANSPSIEYSKPILFKSSKFELLRCSLHPTNNASQNSSFSMALLRYKGSYRLHLVVNLHGPALSNDDSNNSNYEQYLKEVQDTILEMELVSGVALIVLGDMNMDWDDNHGFPNTRVNMWKNEEENDGVMKKLGLTDPFHVLFGDLSDSAYFTQRGSLFQTGGQPSSGRRIDHIFHSDWIEPLDMHFVRYSSCTDDPDFSECDQFASDHYPVLVTLRHYFRSH